MVHPSSTPNKHPYLAILKNCFSIFDTNIKITGKLNTSQKFQLNSHQSFRSKPQLRSLQISPKQNYNHASLRHMNCNVLLLPRPRPIKSPYTPPRTAKPSQDLQPELVMYGFTCVRMCVLRLASLFTVRRSLEMKVGCMPMPLPWTLAAMKFRFHSQGFPFQRIRSRGARNHPSALSQHQANDPSLVTSNSHPCLSRKSRPPLKGPSDSTRIPLFDFNT